MRRRSPRPDAPRHDSRSSSVTIADPTPRIGLAGGLAFAKADDPALRLRARLKMSWCHNTYGRPVRRRTVRTGAERIAGRCRRHEVGTLPRSAGRSRSQTQLQLERKRGGTGSISQTGDGVSMARNDSVSGSPGCRSSTPLPLVYCVENACSTVRPRACELSGELGLERMAEKSWTWIRLIGQRAPC